MDNYLDRYDSYGNKIRARKVRMSRKKRREMYAIFSAIVVFLVIINLLKFNIIGNIIGAIPGGGAHKSTFAPSAYTQELYGLFLQADQYVNASGAISVGYSVNISESSAFVGPGVGQSILMNTKLSKYGKNVRFDLYQNGKGLQRNINQSIIYNNNNYYQCTNANSAPSAQNCFQSGVYQLPLMNFFGFYYDVNSTKQDEYLINGLNFSSLNEYTTEYRGQNCTLVEGNFTAGIEESQLLSAEYLQLRSVLGPSTYLLAFNSGNFNGTLKACFSSDYQLPLYIRAVADMGPAGNVVYQLNQTYISSSASDSYVTIS